MELDEMKQVWQSLDRRLQQQQSLQVQLLRERGMDRLRRGLRPLVWGQSIQIAFGVALMLVGIDFWSTHVRSPHILLWGISVQVFGLLMLLAAVRNLQLVQRIDYGLPVLEIQRRLLALRVWRVRVEAPVFSVLGCFIWIPMMLIWFQWDWDAMGGKGPDFWGRFPEIGTHLLWGGVASLALVAVVYLLLRRFGRRRWLEDNFAGSSVSKAEVALADIQHFEHENS